MGWVHRRRDLGGVIFIHLRDRDGVTQAVFHTDSDPAVHAKAELLRSEYVVAVEGTWSPCVRPKRSIRISPPAKWRSWRRRSGF